jgi:DNA repair ATPase RecN
MVALNKIDLLWDEEKATQAAEASVAKQRANAAETLGIGEELVLAVSAQKGGLAKAQKDEALLQSSGLPALERVVSARMLETKHRTLLDRLQADVGGLLEDNRSRLGARINQVKDQLSELEALREKSGAVIAHLLEKTRREQELYLEGVRAYQASREELIAEAQLGRQILEKDRIDALIRSAHRDMIHSWTTYGLAAAMKTLSDELRRSVQTVGSECERLRRLVRVTFQRFEEELGFSVPLPKVFVPVKFHVETELLCQDVNAFRKNPAILFREQGRVIRRFDQQIVSRAQLLFDQLRVAFDGWLRDALQPLAEQIQQHKHMMEKRLENLQRIGRSKDGLQSRIDDAQRQYVELAKQLTALRNIHNALHFDPTVDEKHSGRPRLVASGV